MGKGPRKTPSGLLRKRGSDYHVNQRKGEPKPAKNQMTPPPELCAKAKKYFEKYAHLMKELGYASDIYSEALGMYCEALVKYKDALTAYKEMKKACPTGVHKNVQGNLSRHPAVGIFFDAQKNLLAAGRPLGFTPADMASISVANPAEVDEFRRWEMEFEDVLIDERRKGEKHALPD